MAAWSRDRRVAIVAGLFTWLAIRSAQVYPHGISYFNSWIGGPEHGIQYLADSNVDWGRDLSALAEYIKRHDIPKIHISYFGTNALAGYFDENRVEILVPPWGPEYAKGPVYQPEPGFYAISANLIPGQAFNPEYRDYYKVFREMEPIARVGYSIHIYYVPEGPATTPPARNGGDR